MTRPLIIKFGGDALASPARIVEAARHLAAARREGPVVAVASARRGVTDHLLGLVEEVGSLACPGSRAARTRAADHAVAAGETVSASLLALALERLGIAAAALSGHQAGLRSDGSAGRGRLRRVQPWRVRRLLAEGTVPVIAGFQASWQGETTTLGRGGSDLSAVALAAALGARCELVKDPPGIFTTDPHDSAAAVRIPSLSHARLRELARAGARVVHPRAAAVAARHGVPLAFVPLAGGGRGTVIGPTRREPLLIARRDGVSVVSFSAPPSVEPRTLRSFLGAIRRLDSCALLVAGRDERGWRLWLAIADADWREAAATGAAQVEGLRLLDRIEGLGLVTVIGLGPGPEDLARARRGIHAAGVEPLRAAQVGARLVFAVPSEGAVPLVRALHAELIERSDAAVRLEPVA